jgi:hypothetical protein
LCGSMVCGSVHENKCVKGVNIIGTSMYVISHVWCSQHLALTHHLSHFNTPFSLVPLPLLLDKTMDRKKKRHLESQQCAATVGRTLSLHYYYLAFIVLTYLAYLIAVNTSYRSSLGTTADRGIQALIALDWLLGESEKHSLSPSIHQ